MRRSFFKRLQEEEDQFVLLIEKNETISQVSLPFPFPKQIEVQYDDERYSVAFVILNYSRTHIEEINEPKSAPFVIRTASDEICGALFRKSQESMFGYMYYELFFNDQTYTVYVVGRGDEGLKMPVYNSAGKQIALIERATLKKYEVCELYAIDKTAEKVALFYLLYNELRKLAENRGAEAQQEMQKIPYSLNKELQSYYNEDFKNM